MTLEGAVLFAFGRAAPGVLGFDRIAVGWDNNAEDGPVCVAGEVGRIEVMIVVGTSVIV
jgi:hypothetical protein